MLTEDKLVRHRPVHIQRALDQNHDERQPQQPEEEHPVDGPKPVLQVHMLVPGVRDPAVLPHLRGHRLDQLLEPGLHRREPLLLHGRCVGLGQLVHQCLQLHTHLPTRHRLDDPLRPGLLA